MLIDFSEQLYQKLTGQIAETEPSASDPASQFKTCLRYTKQALTELELHIGKNSLSNNTEQRQYTEQILPRFRSLEFYYYELAWLVCNRPKGDRYEWMEYYRQELDVIRHFLHRHAAYYQLYKIKTMGLEEVLSEGECKDRWINAASAQDALPIQERTALFSKFIAYDKLQDYLLDQIRLLNEFDALHPHGLRNRQLHWTGDVCNLVELVYGLYETKQINNGEASLNDLVNCMELIFQVNLSRVNRVFIDIKRRKVMSHTRFLEQMRAAIKQKIDQEDAYIPMSFRQGYAKHNQ
ncbi:RteC domain-containing protein [Mucilaginibacter sp. X4EP1]|uniref:RteC domain-containing protein n=1 Tax=Mucilaginibacter sp. X4EP1 TaxID=2723092 RepID=UPI002166EF99|nr:RteC domain-containing protein [Mucilaginibacter sp. X4EP1]MCS3815494.1 hypothetical protein [Mucilaginibacter sp. X4EP1]